MLQKNIACLFNKKTVNLDKRDVLVQYKLCNINKD